jgi:hypothetical protein
MVVKIYSSQIGNQLSTEWDINQFLEKNPKVHISHLAISQGVDRGGTSNYIVVVNYEGTVESDNE